MSAADDNISEGTFGSSTITGLHSITDPGGALYRTALDSRDLVFTWGDASINDDVPGDVLYIPEPSALGLVGLIGLGLLHRRRWRSSLAYPSPEGKGFVARLN